MNVRHTSMNGEENIEEPPSPTFSSPKGNMFFPTSDFESDLTLVDSITEKTSKMNMSSNSRDDKERDDNDEDDEDEKYFEDVQQFGNHSYQYHEDKQNRIIYQRQQNLADEDQGREEEESLEKILDGDDIFARCKDASDLLLCEFLSREDVLLQLLHFITKEYKMVEPPIDAIEEHSIYEKYFFKFPFVSTELLSSPLGKTVLLPKIIDSSKFWTINLSSLKKTSSGITAAEATTTTVTTNTGTNTTLSSSSSSSSPSCEVYLLDELFSFLEKKNLPLHLLKYFVKLVITMTKTEAISERMMAYLYGNQGNYLKKLVQHVSATDDICELLLLCLLYEKDTDTNSDATSDYSDLSSDETGADKKDSSELPSTENGMLTPTKSNGNTASSITVSSNNYWNVKEKILSMLVSLLVEDEYCENVSAIVSTILTLPRPSLLVEELLKKEKIIPIISNLIKKASSAEVFSEGIDFLGTLVIHSQQGDESIQVLFDNLDELVDLLNNPVPLDSFIIGPDNQKIPPLGTYRLKIVEFFVIIFKHFKELSQVHSDLDIRTPLIKCGILPACVKLFFQYENNNILHNLVTHIVTCVLENENSLEEFVEILLDECKLVEKLVMGYNRNKEVLRKTRLSVGYMGHLTIIENFISNVESDNFREKIKSVQGWNQVSEELKEKHFIECIYRHGGNIPLPSNYVRMFVTNLDEYDRQQQQKDPSSSAEETSTIKQNDTENKQINEDLHQDSEHLPPTTTTTTNVTTTGTSPQE